MTAAGCGADHGVPNPLSLALHLFCKTVIFLSPSTRPLLCSVCTLPYSNWRYYKLEDLLYLTQYIFQVHLLLYKWLIFVPLYNLVSCIFFIWLSVDGYTGCFKGLAIMSSAATKTGMNTLLILYTIYYRSLSTAYQIPLLPGGFWTIIVNTSTSCYHRQLRYIEIL